MKLQIYPQWNVFQNNFLPSYFHPTLIYDSQSETESQLNLYVEDPDGVGKKFDDMTYNKGECTVYCTINGIHVSFNHVIAIDLQALL